jgi:hypothetical protein
MTEEQTDPGAYVRTPWLKRVPVVLSLAIAFVVARILATTWWSGVLLYLGTLFLCVVLLRFVFRIPLERMFSYKEFP